MRPKPCKCQLSVNLVSRSGSNDSCIFFPQYPSVTGAKDTNFDTDVAIVISHLSGGGSQRVLAFLVNYWSKVGRRICVITHADREEDFFTLPSSVRRITIRRAKTSRNLIEGLGANIRRIVAIRRALKKVNAKVILSFIVSTNILVVLASFGLSSRVVISERNDPDRQPLGWMWHRLRQLVYRWADVVTANSKGVLHSMRAYVPNHKLALVPNPVDPPVLNTRKREGQSTILNVGSLTHQKAHDVLLDAFSRLAPSVPDWRLSIAGNGELGKALRKQAESLAVNDRIEWHGWVRDINSYYADADIFVLPSRYEGMPNALLEAMSCGLPVIVSDASPGPLEYVKNGVTGLVVPVDNISALVMALERLIHDPPLRRRLGNAARARVAECSLASVIGVWEEILGLPGSQELTTEGHGISRAI